MRDPATGHGASVAGTWRLEGGRVVLEPFRKLDAAARRALREETARVEAFAGR